MQKPLPESPEVTGSVRSYHLPLHRTAALFAATHIRLLQASSNPYPLPSPGEALAIAEEPLRIFAWMAEVTYSI